ncbi:hypothetical protein LJPFL01_3198 [Lelliottia jeotgali]|nr:hypothetical protein LJPFL01_3198 [Lelliottia jeotgali]
MGDIYGEGSGVYIKFRFVIFPSPRYSPQRGEGEKTAPNSPLSRLGRGLGEGERLI